MSNVVKLKNSGTASATPSSLEYGELALNYNDEKIFYKNSADEIVEFSLGGPSISGIEGTVYNATIGNGSDTSYVLTHNFGSRDVSVTIREANSPYGLILTSWEATSTNEITVYFDEAPASSSIRVSVYIAVSGLEVGATGLTGPEGPTGPEGAAGAEGTPGEPGMDGMDGLGYVVGTQLGSSFDPESGWVFDTENAGAFAAGDYVRVVEDSENYIFGFITQVSLGPSNSLIYVNPIETAGDPDFNPSFSMHLAGLPGSNGDTGEIGPGFEYLGEYDDEVTYNIGDVVKVTPVAVSGLYTPSSTYISLVDSNLDNDPGLSPSEWAVLVTDGPEGPTGPPGPPGTLGSALLDDLSDVSVSTPSTGNFLQWDGSQWIATSNSASFNSVTAGGITSGVVGSTTISTDSGDLTIAPASLTVNIGNDLVATGTITGSSVIANSIVFEGSTEDSNETTLQVLDPTADRIISLPDATGTVALSEVIITQQTTSYTLALTDKDKLIEMHVASANNLTVPPESSVNFPVGSQITILQTNTGQTTIVAGAGVTVNATPGLKLRAQWSSVVLVKRASDTWVALGDLQA
jgi:hypothetical protein